MKKVDLACTIFSAVLIAAGGIISSSLLNPIILASVPGSGVTLKTLSECENYKRKICIQNLSTIKKY